jgi:hypothetical protein
MGHVRPPLSGPGRKRVLARLVAYADTENFGYRQLNALWRLAAFGDLARRRTEWGEQRRKGLVRAL